MRPGRRAALLDQLCGGDPELHAESSASGPETRRPRERFLVPPDPAGTGSGRRPSLPLRAARPGRPHPVPALPAAPSPARVGLTAGEVVCRLCGSTFRLDAGVDRQSWESLRGPAPGWAGSS